MSVDNKRPFPISATTDKMLEDIRMMFPYFHPSALRVRAVLQHIDFHTYKPSTFSIYDTKSSAIPCVNTKLDIYWGPKVQGQPELTPGTYLNALAMDLD